MSMGTSNETELGRHIEEMAKMFEKMNFSPMQGRILAYLLSSGHQDKTFDEMVSFFRASKSTISNSLNYLISQKLVDYNMLAGKRKRHFYITENLPVVYMQYQLETIGYFKELSYKTLSFNNMDQKEMNQMIHGWIEFANRYEKQLLQAIQDFDNNKSSLL